MAIFRDKAIVTSDHATSAQRVLREIAAMKRTQAEETHSGSQGVENEADGIGDAVEASSDKPYLPKLGIDTSFNPTSPPSPSPFITQDNYDSPPSANTRNRRQGTITQDHMLNMMEVAAQRSPFTAQQATARRYPLKFLHEAASAILNEETGKLLEYRHLMKHPKYKNIWMKSFGTEIHRLVTMTKTLFF
jgi:hypothetical protein